MAEGAISKKDAKLSKKEYKAKLAAIQYLDILSEVDEILDYDAVNKKTVQ